jgi:deoxyribodipyrimidine photolyase
MKTGPFVKQKKCAKENMLNDNEKTEFYIIKDEIEKLEMLKIKGAIIRSKVKWSEEGEGNNNYFMSLEKQNFRRKHITNLVIDDKLITSPEEILDAEKDYYNNLYKNSIDESSS